MVFGLKSAPCSLKCAMDTTLWTARAQFALIQLDIVLIFRDPSRNSCITDTLCWDYCWEKVYHWVRRYAPSSRTISVIWIIWCRMADSVRRWNWLMQFADYKALQTWLKSDSVCVSAAYFDGLYQILHAKTLRWTASSKKAYPSTLHDWTNSNTCHSEH